MIDFKQPERRQSSRIKFAEEVQVINASLEDGSAYSTLTKSVNLSERGMLVLMPKRLQVSSKAIFIFRLPGIKGQKITSEVKVVWVIPSEKDGFFNTGVTFNNLEPLKQTTIRTFLYGRMHMNYGKSNPDPNTPAQ
ncbi:MAG: PilZ domain-containing protein [Elusimicrobia bacterium]|nr:PilZ domain-containing protein [Elusimicrobiota bacterium]